MYSIRKIANGTWAVVTPQSFIAFLNTFKDAISFVNLEISYNLIDTVDNAY